MQPFAKTHAQLHRRQQLARELEAVRAATEERASLSASQSRRGAGWHHTPMQLLKSGVLDGSSSKTGSVNRARYMGLCWHVLQAAEPESLPE